MDDTNFDPADDPRTSDYLISSAAAVDDSSGDVDLGLMSSDAVDDDSIVHVDHELTSSGAAIRRRATDLADTDAALASLRARTVVAASATSARAAPAISAPAASSSAAASTSMAVASRSAVTTLPRRSRRRLRVGVSLAAAASIAIAVVLPRQHGNRESSTSLQIAAVSPASVTEPTPGAIMPTLTPVTTTSRSCTYTDPAMRAISTARALTCPDGTHVFVDGVIVRDAAGDDWLCDEASGSDQQPCADAGLRIIGSPRSQAGGLLGVKQGDTLLDAVGAATLTSATPAIPSLATVPTTVPITGPIFPPATNPTPITGN